MNGSGAPPTLFDLPVVEVPHLITGEIVADGVRYVGAPQPPAPRIPMFREATDRRLQERAAFVRHHVEEIVKKRKTSAAHRTKGKLLLARTAAAGDTGAGEESRAEYEMAERSDVLAEAHLMALIRRTFTEE